MSTITRTWLAMAAVGAGLIHMALGAGAPLPLAVPLVAIAAAELTWGVVAVMRDRMPLPTAALVGALAPVAGWALLIAAAGVAGSPGLLAPLPFLPMAAATVMGLFVAVVLAVDHRRHTRTAAKADDTASAGAPSTGRYLMGVLVGAVLVSGLTTPALAGTSAGEHAVPHGEHAGH